ncbi:MAG: zinc ribbon domain-containing protein [Lachnospiraceae bacterium]|nr:zinc ribbon domain-containing protein [Lachnospiraceae bacterium]
MFYRCGSCGSNMVYNFNKGTLECLNCGNMEQPELLPAAADGNCPNCGAPLDPGPYEIAGKCPFCGTYHVYEEKAVGEHAPVRIIPTTLTRVEAFRLLQKEYSRYVALVPEIFSDKRLNEVQTEYIPYWVFSYRVRMGYTGDLKERIFRGSDTIIKTRRISFSFEAVLNDVPKDASDRMPDDIMDAVEPFQFKTAREFRPEYLSGARAEYFNHPSEQYRKDAYAKMREKAEDLFCRKLLAAYPHGDLSESRIRSGMQLEVVSETCEFDLLPVYIYEYATESGRKFTYYINGQTEEIYGSVPVSRLRMALGCAAAGALFLGAAGVVNLILVLLGGAL